MISIKPKWVAKILNGEKTIEIRKTMPKCDLPIDVYIYCTWGTGKYNQMMKQFGEYLKINKALEIIKKHIYIDGFTIMRKDFDWNITQEEYNLLKEILNNENSN